MCVLQALLQHTTDLQPPPPCTTPDAGSWPATSWLVWSPRCSSPSTQTSAAFSTLATPTTLCVPSHRCVLQLVHSTLWQLGVLCLAQPCDERTDSYVCTHTSTDCSAPCPTHMPHRAQTSATVETTSTSRALLLLLSTSALEASVCQRPVVFRSRSVTRSAGERAAGNETPVV